MRVWLNKYFGFNKSEFNGLLILVVLIILLKITPYVYDLVRPTAKDSPDLLAKIQKIEISDLNNYHDTRDRIEDAPAAKKGSALFLFDPYHLDGKGWQTLGLSPKQA